MAKCPYCEKEVSLKPTNSSDRKEVRKEVVGTIKKETMYSCPHCQRILGFGYFFGELITGRP